ncbi:MAG: hypothetical protein U1F71_23710 [Verrucomicrobiaceae bacterium]
MNDDELHSLIRQSHPKLELPASFNREVWKRIAVVGQESWSHRWQKIADALFLWIAKPAPALALFTVMLMAGAGLGGLTMKESSASARRTAYLASINPLHPAHFSTQE